MSNRYESPSTSGSDPKVESVLGRVLRAIYHSGRVGMATAERMFARLSPEQQEIVRTRILIETGLP